jgi:hypothetical protein
VTKVFCITFTAEGDTIEELQQGFKDTLTQIANSVQLVVDDPVACADGAYNVNLHEIPRRAQ